MNMKHCVNVFPHYISPTGTEKYNSFIHIYAESS